MAVQDFKKRVRQVAIEQAKVYEQVFLRHEYLLCSEAFHSQPYYIISAHADNYRHLVGVNTSFSAEIFFKKCLDGTLAENDFDFCKRGQSEKEVKGASVDVILCRSTGASFFDEIVYGNERMLAKYRERIKMLLAENLKETKELQPI